MKNQDNREKFLPSSKYKVMTCEKYAEIEHDVPYVYSVEAGGKKLLYFGADHSRDARNAMFKEIEKRLRESQPDIVIIEGMGDIDNKPQFESYVRGLTKEQVINDMGEPGFTLWLALHNNIAWESPEPKDAELDAFLEQQGFSKDQIFLYDMLQILPQYYRQMQREGFQKYLQPYIDNFRERNGWEGDYSYEKFLRLARQFLGRDLDIEHEPDAADWIDPIPWAEKEDKQTILNQISRASTMFRDQKIISGIRMALEEHKSVFVVYGASHAYMQEEAIRAIVRDQQ